MITERVHPKTKKKIWVVDLVKTKKDGTKERYRRDAAIQTRKGAELEEEAVLKQWFETGTLKAAKPEPVTPAPVIKVNTWEDALDLYRKRGIKELKESARRWFEWMYSGPRFVFWNGWDVTKITTTAIGDWQRAIVNDGFKRKGKVGQMSESLINGHRAALMAVLRAVGPNDDNEPGPMLAVLPVLPKKPKGLKKPKKMKAPSGAVVEQLLSAAHPNVRLAFQVAAMLGTRAGEIRALVKSQFDLEAGVVCIDRSMSYGVVGTPKGGEGEYIPIDPRLVPAIKERLAQIGPNDFVCVDEHGQPWTQWALGHRMKVLKEALSLTFDQRVHALRRFFGSETLQTTDLKTTSKMLRHSMVATTEHYLSTDLNRMHEAAEAKAKAPKDYSLVRSSGPTPASRDLN